MLRPIPYTTLSYDPNKHKFYTTDNKEVKGILVIKTIFMGKEMTLSKEWLGCLAILDLRLPASLESHVLEIKFKHIKSNILKNKLIVYSDIDFYVPEHPGFRLSLRYPDYASDSSGNIIDLRTNKYVKQFYRSKKDKYKAAHIYDRILGETTLINTHRLIAETWVPTNDWEENIYINHIDGNKSNNNIANLEWVTTQKNVLHAYDNENNPKRIACSIRNVDTGDVIVCESTTMAAKVIGRTIFSLAELGKDKYRILLGDNGRYEVHIGDNSPVWVYEDVDFSTLPTEGRRRVIAVLLTGEMKCFSSLDDLYRSKYIDQLDYTYPINESVYYLKLKIINIETGVIHYANNYLDATKLVPELSRTTVYKAVKHKMFDKLHHGIYLIRLLSDNRDWRDMKNLSNSRVYYTVHNKLTGETTVTTKMTELYKITGRRPQSYCWPIKNKNVRKFENNDFIVTVDVVTERSPLM